MCDRRTLTFPLADSTASNTAGEKKIRLQVKGDRWAIQYIYAWTADARIDIDEGDDDAVTPPGAPSGVTIKRLSSSKAKVSWAAPTTGSPVMKYKVYARGARPGMKWTKWQSGTTKGLSIKVKLKKAGSKIQVYVTASNAVGTGRPSITVTKKMPKG